MINNEAWIEICEVSKSVKHYLQEDTFQLFFEGNPLASLLLSPTENESSLEELVDDPRVILIHPFVFEFLSHSTELILTDKREIVGEHERNNILSVSVGCLPMDEPSMLPSKNVALLEGWSLSSIKTQNFTQKNCQVYAKCIFVEAAEVLKNGGWMEKSKLALQGRLVKKGCIVPVSLFGESLIIFQITDVLVQDNEVPQSTKEADIAYRIDLSCQLHIELTPPVSKLPVRNHVRETISSYQDIPGYEDELEEILSTLSMHKTPAAPSAILISGPSGIGKTRLASCIAYHYEQKVGDTSICLISTKDLIFRALTENELFHNYVAPLLHDCSLIILDDLNLLEIDDSEDAQRDIEHTIVQNTITQIVDQYKERCRVIGVAQEPSKLPALITKVGRFEKDFRLLPPTQIQRVKIWEKLLASSDVEKNEYAKNWSQPLASATAGCVANDLIRVYQDAWANSFETANSIQWEQLREAAHACIPSQISELDVVKPKVEESDKYNSWDDFAAYDSVKEHIFRNVIVPWKRFLLHMDASHEQDSWIEPPPGVLFHGPSGCGKTSAAECLAGSLALPVIQVRAADVLDKWLGGSEALLRSLFARARAASPCILFLDEIDSIANNRAEDDGDVLSSRILSTLLNEIDGVSSSIKASRVLVVACTNRYEALDSALLRPGRLQEHFYLGLPAAKDLVQILKLRTKTIPLANDFDVEEIAHELFAKGATGADVEGICRDVCFAAFRKSDDPNDLVVTRREVYNVIQKRYN